MSKYKDNNQLLINVAVAGAVGIAAFLLISKLRKRNNSLPDLYEDISYRTQEFVRSLEKQKGNVVHELSTKAAGWADKIFDIVENVTEEAKNWAEIVNDAAAEAHLRAEELELNPEYSAKALEILNWSQKAIQMAESLMEEVEVWSDQVQKFAKKAGHSAKHSTKTNNHIEPADIIQWASLGIDLWKQIRAAKR